MAGCVTTLCPPNTLARLLVLCAGVAPSRHLARALPASFWALHSPQTAAAALDPPTRRQRRQAAAARARAEGADGPEGTPAQAQGETSGGDHGAEGQGELMGSGSGSGSSEHVRMTAAGDGLRAAPLFLHARSLTIARPRKKPLRVLAPLPAHMAAAWRALGWPVPD